MLRQHRPDPVVAAPSSFRPLVTAIAGTKPVGLRTGPASAAALAAAGRPAATVGNVIHLARPLDASSRSAEVLAHELVHVARPSPHPRFFDDDRHSSEESLARVTGGVARMLSRPRAAALLSSLPGELSVGAGANVLPVAPVQRRAAGARPSPPPPVPPSASSPSAQRSIPSRTTAGSRGQEDFVERALRLMDTDAGGGSSGSGSGSRGGEAVQRWASGPAGQQPVHAGSPSGSTTGLHEMPRLSPEQLEQVVEAVEQRVIDELERRGLRYNPGVF